MKKGFTLIELIMVIVILGLLAAIGIPKYIDLSTSAKLSAAKGAIGSFRAAISISYANSAVANGTPSFPLLANLSLLFADGKVPNNPLAGVGNVNGSNQVLATRPGGAGTGTGGWIYYVATGTVESNDTNYTAM